ncbi:MAG: tRNA (N(6)-L-threonylcarbamoyladenosine(37)-C(2))-methylthiotransferase MtaB [Oscillospiraceae bacterium]|nr:tRNA (N(6)-L-threonylcarbamoyladenosine(37)-C(2))-methylthiotransferase MtaB [Oscillospiraceae bacterium]
MQFNLITFGCKVNQTESAGLTALMEKRGWLSVANIEDADVFILNSCTVTENGDKKTRRCFSAAKRKNPSIITVLTGCFPQAYPEEARILNADITCGTADRSKLPDLIEEFNKTRSVINKITDLPETYEEFNVFALNKAKSRAFLKIQDGCDNHCAYCIVPNTKGKPRSRPLSSIQKEVKAAADAGFKEIVLTGINLTKYNDGGKFDLSDAVKLISGYTERVRLSSVEPDLLSEKMLEKLSQVSNLCPHFHLSLQSGSSSVLKRMGRQYTAEEYDEKTQKIRLLFKNAVFTTDIIVGFPGETEEEFIESLRFARKINFSKIHVFPYSARPGTPAASMENQIPEIIKKERASRLMQAADEMRRDFFKTQTGRTLSVLVEKRTSPEEIFGHAENYAPVKVISKTAQKNDILNVKITGVGDGFCIAAEAD